MCETALGLVRGTCDAVASILAAPVLHGQAPPGVAAHAAAQHARRRASAAQHAAGAVAAHLAGLQQRAACASWPSLWTVHPCRACSAHCASLAAAVQGWRGPVLRVHTLARSRPVAAGGSWSESHRLTAPRAVRARRAPGARLARRRRRPAARRRSRGSRAARSAAARASRPRRARRCPSRSPHRSPAPANDRPSRAHPALAPCGIAPQHPHAAVADAALPSPTGGMAGRPERARSLARAPAPCARARPAPPASACRHGRTPRRCSRRMATRGAGAGRAASRRRPRPPPRPPHTARPSPTAASLPRPGPQASAREPLPLAREAARGQQGQAARGCWPQHASALRLRSTCIPTSTACDACTV
jgi:hypothetical protein